MTKKFYDRLIPIVMAIGGISFFLIGIRDASYFYSFIGSLMISLSVGYALWFYSKDE